MKKIMIGVLCSLLLAGAPPASYRASRIASLSCNFVPNRTYRLPLSHSLEIKTFTS